MKENTARGLEVYEFPNSNTYIAFGEARIEDIDATAKLIPNPNTSTKLEPIDTTSYSRIW
ncbi:unnamed protein product [Clonostachys rosea f. rosea IK726]|uniref:Uncharacterized protein n=1 Tax=Clonostachys rosea f. rosea IK726 TaxID=1349383 RepID=A0ACA9TYP7_BIOOC|nr:unnamed protein product [Clonostachys rosea f. rosea IK726]